MLKKNAEKRHIVEKRNVLNQGRWDNPITKQSYVLFLLYLSKINARDPSTQQLVISSDEYKEMMHFKYLRHDQIVKAVEMLFDLKLIIPGERVYHVFNVLEYKKSPDTGKYLFKFELDDEVLHLIFNFNQNYFAYDFENLLELHSCIQIRLYELLKQHEYKKTWSIELEELKKLLYLEPDEYKDFHKFKERILEPNKEILKKHTDIQFDFEITSRGEHGKVIEVKFSINPSTDEHQMTEADYVAIGEALDKLSSPALIIPELEDVSASNTAPLNLREKLNFIKGNVSTRTLTNFYEKANGDIDLIQKAYTYLKSQKNITRPIGFLGFLLDNPEKIGETIEVDQLKPENRNRFANFNQRKNNYEELERLELEQFKKAIKDK